MKLTIQIPRKISLNSIYSGIHFRKRSEHKEDYQWAVMSANPKQYSGSFPVHCHYHFRLIGSRIDVSNHAYMVKMIEDALVACSVFPDDTQDYIGAITVTAEQIKKGNGENTVDITITPVVK